MSGVALIWMVCLLSHLIKGVRAEYLLANRGYDTNAVIEQAKKQIMQNVK